MSKKFLGVLIAVILVSMAGLAYAAVQAKTNGTVVNTSETINFTTGLAVTASGADVTVAVSNVPTSGINWTDLKTATTGVNWYDVTGM